MTCRLSHTRYVLKLITRHFLSPLLYYIGRCCVGNLYSIDFSYLRRMGMTAFSCFSGVVKSVKWTGGITN